ncbi:hypothetical protein SAMN05216383_102157 [Prevotella sp. KH2C16]|nr:hypothetical protein SAMN05216383_102157 [Prevotella sp. KH2C16]
MLSHIRHGDFHARITPIESNRFSLFKKPWLAYVLILSFLYLCNMKVEFNWKKWLVYFIVAAGLIYLTRSFFMSLGIFMLLLLIDWALGEWEKKHRQE